MFRAKNRMGFSLTLASRGGYQTSFSRTVLLSILAMLLFTSPAVAQEKPVFTSQEGSGYEIFKDGTFVIGGDVVGHCNVVLQETRATGTAPSPEILRQVEVCTEAGFPPHGSASLPDTGGPPVLIVAGALLLGICTLGSLGVCRYQGRRLGDAYAGDLMARFDRLRPVRARARTNGVRRGIEVVRGA